MDQRYRAGDLIDFAAALFGKAGLDAEKARVTAALLVEADLMGHTTHGLQLAAAYLGDIEKGRMTTQGGPEVIADRGAAVVWDGRRLPGVWLTASALDLAVERARAHGTGTVVIRRSHHIGCLAAFLPRATERGFMAIIASSDPAVVSVAPFGGTRPLYTPDPIAIGIPAGDRPILVDISASITTNGFTGRMHAEKRRMPGRWLIDPEGRPTDDPGVLFTKPQGSIMPIGGSDYGHKGFGLALMIEALTQGLGGFGRADAPPDWGASVFVQALDPEAFGGRAAFERQTGWLAKAARANPPAPGVGQVRVPGDRALERRARAVAEGVVLYGAIMPALAPIAERLGVPLPAAR